MKHISKSISITFLVFGILFELNGQAQVEQIWLNLNHAVGNRYVYPDLEVMKDRSRGPAYFRDGVVYFDSVFTTHLFSSYDSAFATLSIAYLLSHELGHYYLNHTDTHIKAMAYAKTTSKSAILSGETRKQDLLFKESEADLYGGLYSTQAGYYALDIADQFLNIVYDYYELPKELAGYPSLDDRKEVAKNLESIVHAINESYQIALALAYLGEHSTSQYILKSIIRDAKFQTPEILHLLSYSLFLDAAANINNSAINTWNWPVKIDFNAYKKNNTRSLNSSSIQKNLQEAQKLELNALNQERQTTSNLLESINLVLGYAEDKLTDYDITNDLDSSLISLFYYLNGKQRKSLKYLRSSQDYFDSSDKSKSRIENLGWSPITSQSLFELRFGESQNIILSRKRVAKKFIHSNYSLYEVKAPNGLILNLIREEIHLDPVKPRPPIVIDKSVYLLENSNAYKFQLK